MLVIGRALRRLAARLGDERGFTMVAAMGLLLVASGFGVAAFAAAGGDLNLSRYDQDQKEAYAAAEAGVDYYRYQLGRDENYWLTCDDDPDAPSPNPVNQPWDGTGPDPRRTRAIPGSQARYTVELMPVAPATQCVNGDDASMVDQDSGGVRIRATGFAGRAKRSIVATLRRRGFIDFLYFTDYETMDPFAYPEDDREEAMEECARYRRDGRDDDDCQEIWFAGGDRVNGPLHTNDEYGVAGDPTFGRGAQDRIEASGRDWIRYDANARPIWLGTPVFQAPRLDLPPSNRELRAEVAPAYLFRGKTTIELLGTSIRVNGTTMAFPANGVVYVENVSCAGYDPDDPYRADDRVAAGRGCGNVYVSGTYALGLTIAAQSDVIVSGDVLSSANAMLGLVADNFVRVEHRVTREDDDDDDGECENATAGPQDRRIEAAMLSLAHSFLVDNYDCGDPLGTLTVTGAIGQSFRGIVGTFNSRAATRTGYTKNYVYDDRLRRRSPPHFLDPVQSAWRVIRQVEQVPAR